MGKPEPIDHSYIEKGDFTSIDDDYVYEIPDKKLFSAPKWLHSTVEMAKSEYNKLLKKLEAVRTIMEKDVVKSKASQVPDSLKMSANVQTPSPSMFMLLKLVFVCPVISLRFSFIFLSNWEPKDPGFPGNPIGNIGILFRAILELL